MASPKGAPSLKERAGGEASFSIEIHRSFFQVALYPLFCHHHPGRHRIPVAACAVYAADADPHRGAAESRSAHED